MVWEVCWADDNLDGYLNFYSCSSDGRVTNWTIMESNMLATDVVLLPFQSSLKTEVRLSDLLLSSPAFLVPAGTAANSC